MGKVKKYIRTGELVPGMVLAEEIRFEGNILVNSDVVVTEAILNRLRERYFFGKVAIYSEAEAEAEEEIKKETPNNVKVKTIEEIEESFAAFTFNVEGIFKNIYADGAPDIEEIRSFVKKIQSEIDTASTVIKNIVLHGSGSDAIYRHCVNVAALTSILGRWIGLDDNEVNLLTYSAVLHDFGKTKVNNEIINKIGYLTKKEFEEIKSHPVIAYNSIKNIRFLDPSVSYGVLMHHERGDGSGYPLGIKADKIHNFAKIIAIADVFDAINSDRFHKKSEGPFKALEAIQKDSLGKLDYEYCKIFIDHVINYYMGESVVLNTGETCKIIQIDSNNITRPLLLSDSGFIDLRQEKDLHVEKLVF